MPIGSSTTEPPNNAITPEPNSLSKATTSPVCSLSPNQSLPPTITPAETDEPSQHWSSSPHTMHRRPPPHPVKTQSQLGIFKLNHFANFASLGKTSLFHDLLASQVPKGLN